MKRLIVYLHGRAVGTLDQDESGLLIFQYSESWLAAPDAVPLSRSLPLQAEPFRGKQARPFFAGILPDEGPRQQIAAILGVSQANDFALLERIGGECAGAVSLLPEDVPFPPATERRIHWLEENALREIVAELPNRPLLAGREGIRLSLAGAQTKLPVVVDGDAIGLPLGNTPSTHILKPQPQRFPGLVTNEAFCMTVARAIGLNVPAIATRTIGSTPCILVQRYDRTVRPDGTIERIHQEDFCQALGIPPERKYQQEGGPLVRDCIALLRDWSTAPILDIRSFVDGLILNVLIGNADAHGKNYSLLYRDRERRLAPLYDLVCTVAWPELSTTPAMKIGRSKSIEAITAAHWQKMAEETRLGWPMLRSRIAELAQKMIVVLNDSTLQRNTPEPAIVDRLSALIEKRASSLMARVT